MKYLELLTLQLVLLSGASAESSAARGAPAQPVVPQERRVELRAVLQERRAVSAGQEAQPLRPLSTQERLDLRQQLRRQHQQDVRRPP